MRHAAIPANIPMNAPASTSVGKCTYKYNLEKAMTTARAAKRKRHRLFLSQRTDAQANETAACPEGKE